MNPYQEMVAEFHHATGGFGTVDTPEGRLLRAKLIMEEAVETVAALGFHALAEINDPTDTPRVSRAVFERLSHEYDPLEYVDGLCDLLYVTFGGAVNLGRNLDPHFIAVHVANMAKLSGPKRADGKQLKPEGWQPPNHQRIFDLYHDLHCHGDRNCSCRPNPLNIVNQPAIPGAGPACVHCNGVTQRTGACWTCVTCGATTSC